MMPISALEWRAFGAPADLDVNFAFTRNALVTQLLSACRVDAELDQQARAAYASTLTLAGRIGALAAVLARSRERAAVALTLRCTDVTCGEPFEIALSFAWLLQQADAAEMERSVEIRIDDAGPLKLRRPTGEDQRTWLRQRYPSTEAAERAILESLLEAAAEPGTLERLAEIAAMMEEADPLPSMRVRSACPSCEREDEYAVDLEAVLLAQLQKLQAALLRDVHRLAVRYGWSEAQIAALPAWRRRVYLELAARDE